MLLTICQFFRDLVTQQQMEFSPEFTYKVQSQSKVQNYFSSNLGELDQETKAFSDLHHYLSTEGIAALLGIKLDGYRNEGKDISNTKLIEDGEHWDNLKNYLNHFTGHYRLAPDESIKLMLKIRKGEPAHYEGGAYGVHVVSLYIRNVEGTMKCFLYDSASGLLVDKKDGFHKLTATLENFFKKHYDDKYEIIKTSTLTQSDAINCPVYALAAMKFFIFYGDKLFKELKDDYFVREKDKVIDTENPRIKHLKVDRLPPYLLKLTNRPSLRRVQKGYDHEWMPVKLTLNKGYYTSKDLLFHANKVRIGKSTLKQSLARYAETKSSQTGSDYVHNTLPERRMKSYRRKIGVSLWQHGVIQERQAFDPFSGRKRTLVSIDKRAEKRFLSRLPLIR